LWGYNYSKNLLYQSGRPDLNRRPLDPQEVGFGRFDWSVGEWRPALGASGMGKPGVITP